MFIQEQFGKFTTEGGAKPLVHYVDGETALLAFEDTWRKVALADPAVQPLATTVADLELGAEPLHVLHYGAIEIGNTHFKAMGHR